MTITYKLLIVYLAMVSTAQIGDLQTYRMAVDQLVGLFDLDLVLSGVAYLHSTLQSGFAFSLDDIITAVSLVDKHLESLRVDLDHAAADSKIFQLAVGVALGMTDGDRTRHGDPNDRLMTGKDGDLTGSRRQNHFVNVLIDLGTKQGN